MCASSAHYLIKGQLHIKQKFQYNTITHLIYKNNMKI
jgi:hypothetical protein